MLPINDPMLLMTKSRNSARESARSAIDVGRPAAMLPWPRVPGSAPSSGASASFFPSSGVLGRGWARQMGPGVLDPVLVLDRRVGKSGGGHISLWVTGYAVLERYDRWKTRGVSADVPE